MRTTNKLSFTEYTLQYRHDGRISDGSGAVSEWQDGTGYNNKASTYNHVRQVRAQITRYIPYLKRWFRHVEFRVLAREVTRTEWKEVEINAPS